MYIPREKRNNKVNPQLSVLKNDDLLRKILECIAVQAEGRPVWQTYKDYRKEIRPSRNHLYKAALVSRSFALPALDLLWRIMDSLEPLLDLLLPSILRRDDNSYAILSTSNPSQYLAGRRFAMYSRKVKAFYYAPHTRFRDVNLDWHLFHAINGHQHLPKPLLPCLQTLYITTLSRIATHSFLFNVLSPSLSHVTIMSLADADNNMVRAFITCLVNATPDIKHLHILDHLSDDIQGQLLELRHLRSLRLDGVIGASLFSRLQMGSLNHFHQLETLSMGLPTTDWFFLIHATTISCETLTGLSVHCDALIVFKILDMLSLPRLQEIELAFPYVVTTTSIISPSCSQLPWSGLGTLLVKLVEKWPFSLRSVRVYGGIVTLGSLTCLDQFPGCLHLSHLEFASLGIPLQLSHLDWWYLGRTFPALEHLSLPISYSISWSCLRRLVLMCPRLRYLQVGLDTTSLPKTETTTTSFAHGLVSLSVCDAPVSDTFLTARHLIYLFPMLGRVSSNSSSPSGWDKVNELIAFARSLVVVSPPRMASSDLDVLRSKLIKSWFDPSLPDDLSIWKSFTGP